jgi:hypothetical protein
MGLQASGALTPSQPNPNAALAAQNKAQQQQMQSMEQQATRANAPFEQSQTGGFLTDPAFAAQVADLIGQPGSIGTAQQTIFGTGPNAQQDWFNPQSTAGQQGLASTGLT